MSSEQTQLYAGKPGESGTTTRVKFRVSYSQIYEVHAPSGTDFGVDNGAFDLEGESDVDILGTVIEFLRGTSRTLVSLTRN